MVDLIVRGKLDGGGFSETGLIAAVPEMAVWRYPGLFRTYDEVDRTTAALDPTTRELFARRDLVFVMWADLGFAHVFATEAVASLRALLSLAAPQNTLPLDGTLVEAVTSGRARGWVMPPLYTLAIGQVQVRASRAAPPPRRWSRDPAGVVAVTAAGDGARQCREWQPRLRKSWRAGTERGSRCAREGRRPHQPTSRPSQRSRGRRPGPQRRRQGGALPSRWRNTRAIAAR
jgi:hypothetical protein